MECKSAPSLIILVILLGVFTGCGYFERDGIESQQEIVGHIKLQKQENNKGYNLVYQETPQIFSVIAEDCIELAYDSTSKKIYAECFLNEQNSKYYEIAIIDPINQFVSNAIKKKQIDKNIYIKSLHSSMRRWKDVSF